MIGKRGVLFQSMLNAGTLTFEEFANGEQVPLATIHEAVLDFLRGRDDAVVFGATPSTLMCMNRA